MENSLIIFLLLATILIIQLCIILSIVVGRIVRKKRELQNQIQSLSQSYSDGLKISTKACMRFFNVLTQVYWQSQPEKVLPTLETIFEKLVSDKTIIAQIKQMLNDTRNNIIDRLTQSVSALNSKEVLLYCYLACQLEHNSICVILDKTPAALNAQIYRMRKKIEESGSPWIEEFLEVIS